MRRSLLLAFIAVFGLVAALLPVAAFAQNGSHNGLVARVDGPFTLNAGDSVDNVIVVRGDALIGGTVHGMLLVIGGNADIAGRVEGNVTVLRGDVTLEGGSFVNRVSVINGGVNRASGAQVNHTINSHDLGFFPALFFLVLWIGMTISVIVAGLVFAAIGARQLTQAAQAMTGQLAFTVLGAVAVWLGVPFIAGMVFLTVVGIPFALVLLFVALPLFWLLGYVVAGTRLGYLLFHLAGRRPPVGHPYVAATMGLILLQIVLLLPFFGWAIALLSGIWGSGALAVSAFRAWREPPVPAAPPPVAVS
jgi:hypothetical protein